MGVSIKEGDLESCTGEGQEEAGLLREETLQEPEHNFKFRINTEHQTRNRFLFMHLRKLIFRF